MHNMIDAIKSSLILHPRTIVQDGAIHRFATSKKAGDLSGWYVCHGDFGVYGCWRSGMQAMWSSGREMTDADKKKIEVSLADIETEKQKRHEIASQQAEKIWNACEEDSSGHPYLIKKGIPHYWSRCIQADEARKICPALSDKLTGNLLVIPMRIGRVLHSLQFITADGIKRPLTGGRKKGCYYIIGELDGSRHLCVAEGFATAASIHQATIMPVAVAYDAGNIPDVAQHFGEKQIIVCADNDAAGLAAAEKVKGAIVAVPDVDGMDFNDLADPDKVKSIISAAIRKHASRDPFPEIGDMPCFVVLDDFADYHPYGEIGEDGFWVKDHRITKTARPGTYYCHIPKGQNPLPVMQYICGPIHVDAITADPEENNSGRLLRFMTINGKWRSWSMAADTYLSATGDVLCQTLKGMNVDVATQAHPLVSRYIQQEHPAKRLIAAPMTGWYGKAYATDGGIYGPDAEKTVLQTHGGAAKPRFSQSGTLADWRDTVAAMAAGNPLLVLAISAAFAGAVLKRVGATGGGIHFFGNSSTGKTKLLSAACSVWGGDQFRRSWRMTQNGLETACTESNDCLLAMDEISEHDKWDLRGSIYMIGNGEGKIRMTKDGRPLPQRTWRTMVLSSGERSSTTMSANDKHAGQMIRLIDLWVDRSHGAFDNLQRWDSGAAFADEIGRASSRYYGTAGPAFVEQFVNDPVDCVAWLDQINIGDTSTGQSGRISKTLKIIAMAGELAAKYGAVPWEDGEATAAATEALAVWLDYNDTSDEVDMPVSSIEESELIKQVEMYIRQHEESRFTKRFSGPGELFASVQNHAGWYDIEDDGSKTYYLNSFGFAEAIEGFDRKPAIKQLVSRKILHPGKNKTISIVKIYGKATGVYTIKI